MFQGNLILILRFLIYDYLLILLESPALVVSPISRSNQRKAPVSRNLPVAVYPPDLLSRYGLYCPVSSREREPYYS